MVQTWAYECNGVFPVNVGTDAQSMTTRPQRWCDTRGNVEACTYLYSAGTPVFARVKPIRRLVEKAMRCYKGDIGRVCDICRCSCMFDSVEVCL